VETRWGNGLKILLIVVPDRETGTALLSYISLDDQESTQELPALVKQATTIDPQVMDALWLVPF
jgi:hypothetical protein